MSISAGSFLFVSLCVSETVLYIISHITVIFLLISSYILLLRVLLILLYKMTGCMTPAQKTYCNRSFYVIIGLHHIGVSFAFEVVVGKG